eukprot:jgi/Ulvmu1/3132/UM015_0172.1
MSALAFSSRNAIDYKKSQGSVALKPLVGARSVVAHSFQDPHKVLGVEPGADEKQVKRAYKKLALKFHPDVSEDELAEAKFRGLREAYELLMGKGDPDKQSRAPFGGNWEFHDWYWSFSMRQRQRRQNQDTAPQHSAAAAQKHKPQVRSQLHGLKERAAKRSARASGQTSFVHEQDVAQSAMPDVPVEAPAVATHFSPGPPFMQTPTKHVDTASVVSDGAGIPDAPAHVGLLAALEAHMSRHEVLEAALSRHHTAVARCKDHLDALHQWAQSKWGLRGGVTGHVGAEPRHGPTAHAHVPFQHLGRPPTADRWRGGPTAQEPFLAGQLQEHIGVAHAAAVQERPAVLVIEKPAEADSSEAEQSQAQQDHCDRGQSSRFCSTEEGRSSISAQLAGLRRKAQLQEKV